MCFNLCLLHPVVSPGTTEKSLAPLTSLPSGIYIHWWDHSKPFPVAALLAIPCRRDAPIPSSSLWPLFGLSTSLLHWEAQNRTQQTRCWANSPRSTSWQCVSQCSLGCCWCMACLLSTNIPKSFSACQPAHPCCPLLNFMRYLSAHFSSLFEWLWLARWLTLCV